MADGDGRNATTDDGNGMQCKHARKWDEREGMSNKSTDGMF